MCYKFFGVRGCALAFHLHHFPTVQPWTGCLVPPASGGNKKNIQCKGGIRKISFTNECHVDSISIICMREWWVVSGISKHSTSGSSSSMFLIVRFSQWKMKLKYWQIGKLGLWRCWKRSFRMKIHFGLCMKYFSHVIC